MSSGTTVSGYAYTELIQPPDGSRASALGPDGNRYFINYDGTNWDFDEPLQPVASGGAGGASASSGGGGGGASSSSGGGGNSSPSSAAAAPPSAAERFAAIQAAQITRNTAILEAVRQGILPDATPADVATPTARLSWIARAQGQLSAFWGAAKTKFNNLVGVASPINVAHRGPLYRAIWGSTIYYTPSETDEWLIRAASTAENPYGIVSDSAGIAAAASKNAGRVRVAALNPLLSALIILERGSELHTNAYKNTAGLSAGTVEKLAKELEIAEHEFLRSLFAFLIGYNDALNKKKHTGEEVAKIPPVLRAAHPRVFTGTLQRKSSMNFTSTFAGVGAYKEVVSTPSFFRVILATANDCNITGSSAPIAALYSTYCSEGLPFSSVDRIPIIGNIVGARRALNKEMGDYQGRFTTGDLSAYKVLFQNVARDVRAVSRDQTSPDLSPQDDANVNSHLELEVAESGGGGGGGSSYTGFSSVNNSAAATLAGFAALGSGGGGGGAFAAAAPLSLVRQRINTALRTFRRIKSPTVENVRDLRKSLVENDSELTMEEIESFNNLIKAPVYSHILQISRGGARRTRSKRRSSQKKVRKVKVRKTRVQKKRSTRRR